MKIKRVLTFRAASIGDALMGKYFLENIHAEYPEARCGILVGSRGKMIRNLLAEYPWLSVIEVNRRNPVSLFHLFKEWYPTDLVVTQYSEGPFSTPSKLVARLLSKKLIGFRDSWWGNRFIYNTIIPYCGEEKSEGMIIEERRALTVAGFSTSIKNFSLKFKKDHSVLSRFKLKENDYVIVHLFSGSERRSVSQKRRREIVQEITKIRDELNIVVTGSANERDRATRAGEGTGAQILAGTNINELINLIAGARAIVSLDTGVAHIAAHLGKPLVVLTRCVAKKAWWGSTMYGEKPHVLCNTSVCESENRKNPYPESLETISTEEITSTLIKLL